VCSIVLGALLLAVPAGAQEKNSFAVGVNFTHRLANDEEAHGNGGIGLSWRIGHSDQGWGWTYGLGWFTSDLDRSIDGQRVHFGELKVRPIVGGYGYTHRITDRWYLTGNVVGGFAYTKLNLTPEASSALRAAAHAESLDVKTGFIPVVRPEIRTWYDLHKKWGVTVGAWYAVARPSVTLTTPTSRETLHIRADTFSLSAGSVYSIFRK
jgi:hypothetical protein